MKPTIICTKDKCEACIACLKACPMNAIVIENGRVKIDANRCTNCIHCLEKCPDHALITKGGSIEALHDYQFNICLVPSALLHHFENNDEIEQLFHALKDLGFDEVYSMSRFEAAAYQNFLKEGKPCIASFCPVVKRTIKYDYPTLLENLSQVDYPSEIAARYYRNYHKDKSNMGIFVLAECSAKLGLAKHPYNNFQYEADYTLAIRDIFPLIKLNSANAKISAELYQKGILNANVASFQSGLNHLVCDGLEKAIDVLEMLEFDRLKEFDHYSLFACFNGCIGGDLLWGNPYSCSSNYHNIASLKDDDFKDIDTSNPRAEKAEVIKATFAQRIAFYDAVSEVLATLPGYDCSACGYPNCRFLAEAIVTKKADIDRCRVLKAMDGGKDET